MFLDSWELYGNYCSQSFRINWMNVYNDECTTTCAFSFRFFQKPLKSHGFFLGNIGIQRPTTPPFCFFTQRMIHAVKFNSGKNVFVFRRGGISIKMWSIERCNASSPIILGIYRKLKGQRVPHLSQVKIIYSNKNWWKCPRCCFQIQFSISVD